MHMNTADTFDKHDFIRLALDAHVLRFGQFTLKSGRISPYFFNAGMFYQAHALRRLGQYYANTILKHHVPCRQLFGPAYKGLPLATAAAIGLAERGEECTVTFNRKEVKDHAEGGLLIGAPLEGKTLMIDDVISAGTTFRESKDLIHQHGGELAGVVIAMNRCERGQGEQSAVSEIKAQGIEVYAIISFHDLVDYLKHHNAHQEADMMEAYYKQYGEG